MFCCGFLAVAIVSATAQDKEAKKGDADKKEPEKKAEPDKKEPVKKAEPDEKKDEPKKLDIDPKQVGGFRMYLVSDSRFDLKDDRNRVGKLHDPVTEYSLNTVVAVFARKIPTDPKDAEVPLMKMQQELAAKYRFDRFGAFFAFLALKKDFSMDDERDTLIEQVRNIAKTAEVPLVSVGLAEATVGKEGDDKDGAQPAPQVTAWGIGPEDQITVVLYYRLKFVKRWKFTADKPPTEADLKEISAAVDAHMGRLLKR
jgi:hypothetical protein